MPENLCCTSDFNGDGLLSVEDYRIYFLWSQYVNKTDPIEDQKLAVEALYTAVFPLSPPVTVVSLPELDCADYDDDDETSVSDYRSYFLWSQYVDKEQPLGVQLSMVDALYVATFPASPIIVSARVPELLNPDNCAIQHGWFVTPWHSKVELAETSFGWLE